MGEPACFLYCLQRNEEVSDWDIVARGMSTKFAFYLEALSLIQTADNSDSYDKLRTHCANLLEVDLEQIEFYNKGVLIHELKELNKVTTSKQERLVLKIDVQTVSA